jgi:CRP-like cAMP-binding protein
MEKFKSKNFEAGEVLLAEGKKGTGLFILLYGSLEVAKTQGADTVVLATLGPGDMFGEMSLLTNQPTVASVTATSDCFVLRLSKKKFDELIMTHPQILELVALVSDERASLNDALMGDAQAFNAGAVLV